MTLSINSPTESENQREDSKNYNFKGFPYPLERNNPRGFFYRAKNHELIKADLIQLLLTEPGERVMMPSYGTGIKKFLFEFRDDSSSEQLISLISKAITAWENRIVVGSINVNFIEDDSKDNRFTIESDNIQEYTIIISIDYALKENLTDVQKLDFKVGYDLYKV